MSVTIDIDAVRTVLYALLSCQCPVTETTEGRLVRRYFNLRDEGAPSVDFECLMSIARGNPDRTPLHNLFDFCSYAHDDPADFRIVQNDVLRCFASRFHYNIAVRDIEGQNVANRAEYLFSHMLMAVTVDCRPESVDAFSTIQGKSIRFRNCYLPPDIPFSMKSFYALHMGTILSPISGAQSKMIEAHLGVIGELMSLVQDVSGIDFTGFQKFGNYHEYIASRFQRHFPLHGGSRE